jgi:hypothetical protein
MDRDPELFDAFFPRLFIAVIVVQGVHVFEHVVQLIQVYRFGVADDDALGLLGYVFQFNGTEEWLHLVFNVSYLLALYLLIVPMKRLVPSVVPERAFNIFLLAAVGVETGHVIEHGVIISNVIRHGGCPCPGIGDRLLNVTDTQLHFVYNVVAYAGVLVPFWYFTRARRHRVRPAPGDERAHAIEAATERR